VLPHQSTVVPVEVTGIGNTDAAWLVESDNIEGHYSNWFQEENPSLLVES